MAADGDEGDASDAALLARVAGRAREVAAVLAGQASELADPPLAAVCRAADAAGRLADALSPRPPDVPPDRHEHD